MRKNKIRVLEPIKFHGPILFFKIFKFSFNLIELKIWSFKLVRLLGRVFNLKINKINK